MSKLLFFSFSMFGPIFGFPHLLCQIETLARFLGEFWTSLWRMMDTKLKISIEFHPQTNGQIEVVNRTMVHLLRGYCGKHLKLWEEQLPYVKHAYNRAAHSLHRTHHLRHVLAIYLEIPWTWSLGNRRIVMDDMTGTKQGRPFSGYR